jgi:outer membrane protein assembly factor BamA
MSANRIGRGRGAGPKIRGVLALALLAAGAVQAQSVPDNARDWRLVLDGRPEPWPSAETPPTPDAAAQAVLASLHREGYLLASADSLVDGEGIRTLYATRGQRPLVASVRIEGARALDPEGLLAELQTRPGRPLLADLLAADLRQVLEAYDAAGFPLARAEVASLDLGPEGVEVSLRVEEGAAPVLAGLELAPASRTDPAFAARMVGLRVGAPLAPYRPEAIRRDLEATGLFERVGEPELVLEGRDRVTVRVPVEEGPPGAVDLVLGYLPPAFPGEGARLVGSGSLVLGNLFGRGRRVAVELQRHPGLVSALDARASDPFVAGLPLRAEVRFSGYQQDSTFTRQRFGGEMGYRLAPGLELVGTVSREAVETGIAGARAIGGRPVVPPSDAWFAGAGVRFLRVDRPLNPRRGVSLSTLLEQGSKRRTLPDSALEAVSVRQQRLLAEARLYVPTLPRQSVVVGGEGAALVGDVYDASDLFRVGGAASLRGYDEERFEAHLYARALVEYRYALDPTSFAFAFFDLGYLQRPETPGVPSDARWAPGYGLGLQYRTPLGLATATLALNPEDGPTRARVHVGLSVGL